MDKPENDVLSNRARGREIFSIYLKKLIKEKGFTQIAFSFGINVPTPMISWWMNAKRDVPKKHLGKIAKFFDIPFEEILKAYNNAYYKLLGYEEKADMTAEDLEFAASVVKTLGRPISVAELRNLVEMNKKSKP
jgi:transcriptional regulator with XRE-family HTH domain